MSLGESYIILTVSPLTYFQDLTFTFISSKNYIYLKILTNFR